MLIDTHCHLASYRLLEEIELIVKRACEQDVHAMVTIGTDLDDCRDCLKLAETYPNIYATVGVHPTSVTEVTAGDWLQQIEAMAQHPKVVAIGEIGLDYFHKAPEGWTRENYVARQKDFFRKQLNLAAQLGKNVVVHTRESWEDNVSEVSAFKGKLRAVFHCHTGSWQEAERVASDGHLVSFTGIATFKNALEVREAVIQAKAGQFMLETDSPYLAPVPYRGKRCEPSYVRLIAETIADFRGETVAELSEHTTATAEAFFGIV